MLVVQEYESAWESRREVIARVDTLLEELGQQMDATKLGVSAIEQQWGETPEAVAGMEGMLNLAGRAALEPDR